MPDGWSPPARNPSRPRAAGRSWSRSGPLSPRAFRFAAISACCRSTCSRKAATTSKARPSRNTEALLADAQALADAGAFAVVLELVTPPVAREIYAADFHSHHRHRQRAGLRRADSGDARFARHVSLVHAAICEAAGGLRGGNQVAPWPAWKNSIRDNPGKTFCRQQVLRLNAG